MRLSFDDEDKLDNDLDGESLRFHAFARFERFWAEHQEFCQANLDSPDFGQWSMVNDEYRWMTNELLRGQSRSTSRSHIILCSHSVTLSRINLFLLRVILKFWTPLRYYYYCDKVCLYRDWVYLLLASTVTWIWFTSSTTHCCFKVGAYVVSLSPY